MANIFSPSIEGDGISFTFFLHLWNKNRNEERNEPVSNIKTRVTKDLHVNPIRVPDTVIFQLGQPLHWYFTSERGKQPTILRKRKQNVNVEKIAEEFVRKCKAKNNGNLCQHDVVAYFIASSDCTIKNRRSSNTTLHEYEGKDTKSKTPETLTGHYSDGGCRMKSEDGLCDIEYFNEEELYDFLNKRRKNQSGILQRFIEPSGGGTHNSQIRAICTPKLCILERRKTKQELHDSRFGLYERAVTFDGPEVHSTSLPIKGSSLPGKLRDLCDKVLNHMSEATRNMGSNSKKEVKMVLNLKVDSKEKIWLLYSNSIRTVHSDTQPFASMHLNHVQGHKNITTCRPLNIQEVIKLPTQVKLNQMANHDPTIELSNKVNYISCPSCQLVQLQEHFHPVPYKTVMTHYEQVMAKGGNKWPPSKEIIKSAGGVGFGKITHDDHPELSINEIQEENLVIPPMIRHFHKRLKAEGYRRYRSDPLFLHKHCDVCESCFLSYAHLVNTSFQIKVPIKLDTDLKHLGFKNSKKMEREENIQCIHNDRSSHPKVKAQTNTIESFASEISIPAPMLPTAIKEPPSEEVIQYEDFDRIMPISYDRIECPSQPLRHLLEMHESLEKSRVKSNYTKKKKRNYSKQLNPYEIPLDFVDGTEIITKTSKREKVHPKIDSCNSTAASAASAAATAAATITGSDEDTSTLLSRTLVGMLANERVLKKERTQLLKAAA